MKKILTFFVASLMGVSLMAQNADLKLNLEKGKVYRFTSVSNQNVSQTINGMEQTTTVSNNANVSIKAMDATADFIVAEVKIDSIVNSTNTMGKLTKINSSLSGNIASEDAGEVLTAIYSKLYKNPIYVKIAPNGNVTDVVNLPMLRDIVLKDTGLLNSKVAPTIKPQIVNMVTLDAFKTIINTFTYNLPVKPVKMGDLWTIDNSINSGGMSLDFATNYKVTAINNNTITTVAETTIKPALNAAPIDYPGAKITYDGITGFGKSDILFDSKTGLVTLSTTKINITGDLAVSASGMNMQIPMKVTGETTIKSL